MRNLKKPIAIATVPVLIVGWALFRPELLFVDKQVNEKLPSTTAQKVDHLADGAFSSYAHETTGKAEILKADGKAYLSLSDFKTSNGPDVHVYLVKGNDPSQSGVNQSGFLDLGSIKGNVGDQHYELPASADLTSYRSVSIWCKRFGVDFGGAALTFKSVGSANPSLRLASYAPEIRVTHGTLKGSVHGNAELIESSGKRFVRLTGLKLPAGRDLRVLLVKAESPTRNAEIASSPKIELGRAKTGTESFPIGSSVDAWLYRAVSIWDVKTGKSLSIALLRSDQEHISSI